MNQPGGKTPVRSWHGWQSRRIARPLILAQVGRGITCPGYPPTRCRGSVRGAGRQHSGISKTGETPESLAEKRERPLAVRVVLAGAQTATIPVTTGVRAIEVARSIARPPENSAATAVLATTPSITPRVPGSLSAACCTVEGSTLSSGRSTVPPRLGEAWKMPALAIDESPLLDIVRQRQPLPPPPPSSRDLATRFPPRRSATLPSAPCLAVATRLSSKQRLPVRLVP